MPTYIRYIGSKKDKKKRMKKLVCPICKKELIGREALSRHISHAHRKINQVRREKMVIDKYFGTSQVKKAIDGYKNREYSLNGLPIDITRYIKLAKIKPFKVERDKDDADDNGKIKYRTIDIRDAYPVIKIVHYDVEGNLTKMVYAYDCFVLDGKKVVILTTANLEEAIAYKDIANYLRSLSAWSDLKHTKIYVEYSKRHNPENEIVFVSKLKKVPYEEIDKDHRAFVTLTVTDEEFEKDSSIDEIIG
jgi:hypothetical protein